MMDPVDLTHLVARVAYDRYGCQWPHWTDVRRAGNGLVLEFHFDWTDTTYCISLRASHALLGRERRALDQAAWRLSESWRDGVGQMRVLDEARSILYAMGRADRS